MRTTTWIAVALTLALAGAGCGGDPADADADGADELSIGPEQLQQDAVRQGRADLELTAAATPIADGTAEVMVELALLDRTGVFEPTVTFDLPVDVTVPVRPNGCEPVDQQLVCALTDYYDTFPLQLGDPPVGPLQLTITLQVDDGLEDPIVTLTATSRANGLDNDPDPTNNIVQLTLTTEPPTPATTAATDTPPTTPTDHGPPTTATSPASEESATATTASDIDT